MKKWFLFILLLVSIYSAALAGIYGTDIGIGVGVTPSAGGPAGDALLLETGDYLLLETGDYLLLE